MPVFTGDIAMVHDVKGYVKRLIKKFCFKTPLPSQILQFFPLFLCCEGYAEATKKERGRIFLLLLPVCAWQASPRHFVTGMAIVD